MLHAEEFVMASGGEKGGAGLKWDGPSSWTMEVSRDADGNGRH